MGAGHHTISHGRVKVSRQQQRIAEGQRPVAGLKFVAVAERGDGEFDFTIFLLNELDERKVASAVEADQHGVIHFAGGKPAMKVRTDGGGYVEIGEGIAIVGDEDAGAAALTAGCEYGDDRLLDLLNESDALGLGVLQTLVEVVALRRCQESDKTGAEKDGREIMAAITDAHSRPLQVLVSPTRKRGF